MTTTWWTLERFLSKAEKIHGGKHDLSQNKSISSAKDPITVICNTCSTTWNTKVRNYLYSGESMCTTCNKVDQKDERPRKRRRLNTTEKRMKSEAATEKRRKPDTSDASRIAFLEDRMKVFERFMSKLSSENLSDIQQHLSELEHRVDDIEGRVDEMELDVDISGGNMRDELDELESRLDEIETRVDDIEEKDNDMEEKEHDVEQRLDEMEYRLDDIGEKVDELELEVDVMGGKMDDMREELDDNIMEHI